MLKRKIILILIIYLSYFMVLFCLIVPDISGQDHAAGLDKIIPPSPRASSLGRYGDIPVNLYSGTPEISIPIYMVQGKGINVPVSLSYNASGIKVEDIPGWVGLGWTVQAGGIITRTVRGRADDLPGGFLNNPTHGFIALDNDYYGFGTWRLPLDRTEREQYLDLVHRDIIDTEPDLYYFNINGQSGKFVFDVDGSVVIIPQQNLRIEPQQSTSGEIQSWKIWDGKGNLYTFGKTNANEISFPRDVSGAPLTHYISSWYLAGLRSLNGEDEILFEYHNHSNTYRHPIPLVNIGCSQPNWDHINRYTLTRIEEKYLKSIRWGEGSLLFDTIHIGGYPGGKILALNKIRLVQPGNIPYKQFDLSYDFFENIGCGTFEDFLPPCKRLRLNKITEKSSRSGQISQPYRFFYNNTPLPPRGSFSQDYWGYYNGEPNENPLPSIRVFNYSNYEEVPPVPDENGRVNFDFLTGVNLNDPIYPEKEWRIRGANKNPDESYAKAGILNRIVYPTGGCSQFEYELNDFSFISYPGKPEKISTKIGNGFSAIPLKNSTYFRVDHSQDVRVIPLFGIIPGSNKEQNAISPGANSRLKISQQTINNFELIFEHSFEDQQNLAGGWEMEFPLWLEKGNYRLEVLAEEPGDITQAILFMDSGDIFDEVYKIYSDEFTDTLIQLGSRYWPDDRSVQIQKSFQIEENDDKHLGIQFTFYSLQNPKAIPTGSLELPYSSFRILDALDTSQVYFEIPFLDQYSDSIIYNSNLGHWVLEGTRNLQLPSGDYILDFRPRIDLECGMIMVSFKKFMKRNLSTKAGGLRIKRITELDNLNDTLTWTEYVYQKNGESQGVIISFPTYTDLPEKFYYGIEGTGTLDYNCFPIKIYTKNNNALGASQGGHIGYREVQTIFADGSKTLQKFTSPVEYPDVTVNRYPYPPRTSFDWKRGKLIESTYVNKNGITIETNIFEYNLLGDTIHRKYIPGMRSVKRATDNMDAPYEKYLTVSGWDYLSKQTKTNYDTSGLYPITVEKRYVYDPEYLFLRKSSTINSDGGVYYAQFRYATDFVDSDNHAYDTLIARHAINLPLEEIRHQDSTLISEKRTIYGLYHQSSLVLPSKTEEKAGSQWIAKQMFTRYDTKGNLLEYRDEANIPTSINWDNMGLAPIQVTKNTEYFEDTSKYGNDKVFIRYKYLPLVGLINTLDPNNLKSEIHYDELGRMTYQTDFEGNIIKHINYNLKEYAGDTLVIPGLPELIFSRDPLGILTDHRIIPKHCSTILTVDGGLLGTDASWIWYRDYCSGIRIGEGNSITVSPNISTNYYVRAEGEANVTMCDSITIEVLPNYLDVVPANMTFNYEGLAYDDTRIIVHYNGCDPIDVRQSRDWIILTGSIEGEFEVACARNQSGTDRLGIILISGGDQHDTIAIFQEADPPEIEIALIQDPVNIFPGEFVTINAEVFNGVQPYHFIWEKKEEPSNDWTFISERLDLDIALDSIVIQAGVVDFEIRCTAITAKGTVSKTIYLTVVQ